MEIAINRGNYQKQMIEISSFDSDNIRYIKPLLFYKVSRSLDVHYNHESETGIVKKVIVVRSPLMMIPFEVSTFENDNGTSCNISLSFANLPRLHNGESVNKFYQFIKAIDDTTEETVLDNRKRWGLPKKIAFQKTLKRLSEEYSYFMNVGVICDPDNGYIVGCLDEDGKKASFDIFKKRCIVSAILELTDITFTDKTFRVNWTLCQIRKFRPYSNIQYFFFNEAVIDDEDNPDDVVTVALRTRTVKIPEPPKPPVIVAPKFYPKVVPSVDQLQDALSKLKPKPVKTPVKAVKKKRSKR